MRFENQPSLRGSVSSVHAEDSRIKQAAVSVLTAARSPSNPTPESALATESIPADNETVVTRLSCRMAKNLKRTEKVWVPVS